MCYKIYYSQGELDPTFPEPRPPKEMFVPTQRHDPAPVRRTVTAHVRPMAPSSPHQASLVPQHRAISVAQTTENVTASGGARGQLTADQRRNALKEVREHLDILKEFEGVISPEELAQRKRELFLALPTPSSGKKRAKH